MYTIYQAKKIVTMDMNLPIATHVAVKDGRILSVGNYQETASWGDHELNKQFADKVLMPGFVEGHAHTMAGGVWENLYLGYHDRIDPQGKHWSGLRNIDAVINRLAEATANPAPDKPIIGWGFDPIFFSTERLNIHHLDKVSSTQPIVIIHSNFHLMTVNSAVLKMVGYNDQNDIDGLSRFPDGKLNGEIHEMHAMFPVYRRLDISFRRYCTDERSIRSYGSACLLAGVTTATDLFSEVDEQSFETLKNVTDDNDFPIRLVPALSGVGGDPDQLLNQILQFREKSTAKLRMGIVKLMADGSIQGFTAKLRWPYYFSKPDGGIWNIPPETMERFCDILNRGGVHMHIHTNGDLAIDMVIEVMTRSLKKFPFPDHRHTLQHCQMASAGQFRRLKALGMCANLFANHIYYFGDKHREVTIGPDRARRMNACRTALDLGVPLAIHSDAPVTPMNPLFTAWCAVNRLTESGQVLGEEQAITVDEALYAITLGAAYTLKLDDEIGSIETGKRADITILEDDPLTVDPKKLKDIKIAGTMLGGKVFSIPGL